MNRYVIVLSVICLSFLTNLYSQSCNLSVSGKITDLHDESPIIGALVFIEGTNNFSQTDENGKYLIENVCAGPIQLKVEYPGCKSVEKKLDIKKLSIETGAGEFFKPARKLFKQCGFEICDPFAHYKEDINSVYLTKML